MGFRCRQTRRRRRKKGAQHQGKPPVKNGQHDGKQAQYNSKQPQRDGKQPQHDGKQPQHNGKQPPGERAQRETAAAESVTLWPGFRVRPFFIPSSAIVDKLLPFFEMPGKKPALCLT